MKHLQHEVVKSLSVAQNSLLVELIFPKFEVRDNKVQFSHNEVLKLFRTFD